MRLATWIVLSLLLGICRAGVATAQDPRDEARKHFMRGLELIREDAFAAAIIEFETADQLSPNYKVLYNIGMAHVALGQAVEALEALQQYLERGGSRIPQERRLTVADEIARQKDRTGQLTVTVSPPDATIRVDGREQAAAHPIRLGIGEHTVEATRDDHGTSRRRVKVFAGSKQTLSLTLAPAPQSPPDRVLTVAMGQLAIDCPIPDVTVRVADRVVGTTPFDAPVLLEEGTHVVRFERTGYTAPKASAVVQPSAVATLRCGVRVDPQLDRTVTGKLELVVSEADARITVDGARSAAHTALPMGAHVLRIERHGFRTEQRTVTVQAGQVHRIDVTLTPTPEFRAEYEKRARTRRTAAWSLTVASAALAGGALGLHLWNNGRFARWRRTENELNQVAGSLPTEDRARLYRDNDDDLQSINAVDMVTLGLGVTAGAALITGAVFWSIGEDPQRYRNVSVAAHRDGAGLLVRGRF